MAAIVLLLSYKIPFTKYSLLILLLDFYVNICYILFINYIYAFYSIKGGIAMSDSKMIKDGDDHKGGNGKWVEDHIHYSNYSDSSHTSWDEDSKGNVSNVHSTNHDTREKTQHCSDDKVKKY
jgi:hypothetical protein